MSLYIVLTTPATPTDTARFARMAKGGEVVSSGKLVTKFGSEVSAVYAVAEPELRRPVKKRQVKR